MRQLQNIPNENASWVEMFYFQGRRLTRAWKLFLMPPSVLSIPIPDGSFRTDWRYCIKPYSELNKSCFEMVLYLKVMNPRLRYYVPRIDITLDYALSPFRR